MPNAHRAAGGAHQLHLRNRYRALLLGDTAFGFLAGAKVLFHHHHVLDQNFALVGEHAKHAPLLSLVAAAQHLYGVVAPNINSLVCSCNRGCHLLNPCHSRPLSSEEPTFYKTSGARLTIFKNFFSRNSLATGPNTRVPTGSPASLINTAAF